MTQSPTSVRTESGHEVVVRTRFIDPAGARRRAKELQKRGLTLSEIAEEMDCRREAVAHMLYWEAVRS